MLRKTERTDDTEGLVVPNRFYKLLFIQMNEKLAHSKDSIKHDWLLLDRTD